MTDKTTYAPDLRSYIFLCMQTCVYVCMCVCVCACMYVCMYACMHACTYTYTCVDRHTRVYIYYMMQVYACMHACTGARHQHFFSARNSRLLRREAAAARGRRNAVQGRGSTRLSQHSQGSRSTRLSNDAVAAAQGRRNTRPSQHKAVSQ